MVRENMLSYLFFLDIGNFSHLSNDQPMRGNFIGEKWFEFNASALCNELPDNVTSLQNAVSFHICWLSGKCWPLKSPAPVI